MPLALPAGIEKRMSSHLGQAVLDDLLIPSSSLDAGMTFDVDAVQRILAGYLEHESEAAQLDYNTDDDFISAASPPNDVGMIGRLMEAYLAEIASDTNLPIDKFTGQHVPRHRHVPQGASASERAGEEEGVQGDGLPEAVERPAAGTDDGSGPVPRAAAPARGAHPSAERRVVVPAPTHGGESPPPSLPYKPTPSLMGRHTRGGAAPADEVSQLQRENDELKMELLRLKMRLRGPVRAAPSDWRLCMGVISQGDSSVEG
ncbi:BTB/POZ domain-containing protein At5g67385-like [Setaria italica]|uniref:BTB/POZ domain-containing protein At5g67385-like n=1 Tax=Setaria italica TaxID=4555 RepID=UPI000BE61BC4|nr:BTB/POZ domain-containing protein At5g67385-like [Setaria italica]